MTNQECINWLAEELAYGAVVIDDGNFRWAARKFTVDQWFKKTGGRRKLNEEEYRDLCREAPMLVQFWPGSEEQIEFCRALISKGVAVYEV